MTLKPTTFFVDKAREHDALDQLREFTEDVNFVLGFEKGSEFWPALTKIIVLHMSNPILTFAKEKDERGRYVSFKDDFFCMAAEASCWEVVK